MAAGEEPVGVPDAFKRERGRDWHLQLADRDEASELGEGACARPGGVALRLHAVLSDRTEVRDRVDALRADAELDRELHVVAALSIDERVDLRRGLANAVGDTVAV